MACNGDLVFLKEPTQMFSRMGKEKLHEITPKETDWFQGSRVLGFECVLLHL
jgi:hypothetical protein